MTSHDSQLGLNERARQLCERLTQRVAECRVVIKRLDSGCRVIDCGAKIVGGLEAGRAMAEICLAGLGRVSLVGDRNGLGPLVQIATDQPVAACMASQYAGWQIAGDKFFAMGSGPMRAAFGDEKLFDDIGCREQATHAVGVLETSKLPPDAVCQQLAESCRVPASELTLLVARTASLAGSFQVVARSVETALHKLHELGFDLGRVVSGFGSAPLPPIAADDLKAIGLTNDAVLYGGDVTLWVTGDDDTLSDLGPKIPSSASDDHGQPFADIFERYDRDFYKIDPLLFSPARVTLINIGTGRSHRFGELRNDILRKSFGV